MSSSDQRAAAVSATGAGNAGSAATVDLDQLVKEADIGGREPTGVTAKIVALLAGFWSLFQIWYASPLPFVLRFGVLNDTEARAIHLALAIFLAFMAYPAWRRSSRSAVPITDWVLALLGAFCAAYLFLFYNELSTRPGKPTQFDLIVGVLGIVIMLEATRRAMGMGMLLTTGLFLLYVFAGPYMPDALQHKGSSLQRVISHMWLTTEGVYGVGLGVSVQFIFLFVLFGTLLDRAGAGNYMTQASFALLGHLRGGPAKVAVVSSALNGVVSGSSVSNVVSGGIFTIPLMMRTGYSGVKAGAIEAASSINGQIMPPVMGAAAFLMVEYVGLSYPEICKHAALPAIISYIALFYMVHLEALKADLKPFARGYHPTFARSVLGWGLGLSGTLVALVTTYYAIVAARWVFGDSAFWVVMLFTVLCFVGLLAFSSRYPDVPEDDPHALNIATLRPWTVLRAGLHFFIPIVVLLWCITVEELSPATSAFWAVMAALLLTLFQPVLLGLFRGQGRVLQNLLRGLADIWHGCVLGARNMIGIAVACASAGLIVGAVTLTGVGLMMTDFVEIISAGNVLIMLLMTAVICLLIGAGVPTTANYILVATLMAPVIVELGARSGLVIPLIGVHLFVFYFGIMADVTPPVGLASYAAAAISGADPNATGMQATWYSFRTGVLPFVFIFNPALMFIGVSSWWQVVMVSVSATLAALLFAAATMGWFRVRCTALEIVALLLATFLLFRPDWLIDQFVPKHVVVPASEIFKTADGLRKGDWVIASIAGENIDGRTISKTVAIPLGEGSTGRDRLRNGGVTLGALGAEIEITNVKFGSQAKKLGVEQGYKIAEVKQSNPNRPADYWSFIPALMIAGFVWWRQAARQIKS